MKLGAPHDTVSSARTARGDCSTKTMHCILINFTKGVGTNEYLQHMHDDAPPTFSCFGVTLNFFSSNDKESTFFRYGSYSKSQHFQELSLS